jgi:hypothetical protein
MCREHMICPLSWREVVLRAMSGEITWIQAAEIIGCTPRSVRQARARMRTSGATALALLLALPAINIASSQTRPAPPAAEEAAAPGHPGWSVDARDGCWVWNSAPKLAETVTWTGSCSPDGRAIGFGVSEWRHEQHGEQRASRYEGEYRDGKASGRGTYVYTNGDRYEGEWRDNKLNGRGTYTYATGGRYVGEWRNDRANGRGVYTSPSGDRYEGEWREDCFGKGNRRLAFRPLSECP